MEKYSSGNETALPMYTAVESVLGNSVNRL
jgi:hypothetical protein